MWGTEAPRAQSCTMPAWPKKASVLFANVEVKATSTPRSGLSREQLSLLRGAGAGGGGGLQFDPAAPDPETQIIGERQLAGGTASRATPRKGERDLLCS